MISQHNSLRENLFTKIFQITGDTFNLYSEKYMELVMNVISSGGKIGFHVPVNSIRINNYIDSLEKDIENKKILLFGYTVNEVFAGSLQLIKSSFEDTRHLLELAKMIVSPGYRKLGIAAALMNYSYIYAKTNNYKLICLSTCSDSFTVNFYKKCGYKISGIIPNYIINSDGSYSAVTKMFVEVE